MRRTLPAFAAAAALLLAAPAQAAEAARCPTAVDPADLAGLPQLRDWNEALDRFGLRRTGDVRHRRYVNWLERRMRSVPGLTVRSIPYRIDRWEPGAVALHASLDGSEQKLPVAAPVPYAKGTPRAGVSAPLVYVPPGTPIESADVRGKVVVRDAVAGTIPNRLIELTAWYAYDPKATFDPDGIYERDWLTYEQRVEEIEQAGSAGAAALLYVHDLAREAIRGHYSPYEGVHWKLPALHLGSAEGERLKRAIAAGAAGEARVVLRTRRIQDAPTRTLVGRLDGPGRRRVVIETHTDGVNPLWDNGSVPMLALAHHFARLPLRCRPRPLEFVFTTGHLHQRIDPAEKEGGAGQYAELVDRDYDRGRVSLALVLEHFGAREYEAVPGPRGRVLRRTGLSEPVSTFVSESQPLVDMLSKAVERRRVERWLLLKGATLPDPTRVPPYCSFGGEGIAYVQKIIPTVAFITAPWTLYNPGYGMEQIDMRLLRRQTLVFGDFLLRLRSATQGEIAGAFTQYRRDRRAGKPTCHVP